MLARQLLAQRPASPPSNCCDDEKEKGTLSDNEGSSSSASSVAASPPRVPISRVLPPFILSHDITRAAITTARAAIGYIIMLAVMYVTMWTAFGVHALTRSSTQDLQRLIYTFDLDWNVLRRATIWSIYCSRRWTSSLVSIDYIMSPRMYLTLFHASSVRFSESPPLVHS